MRQLRDEHETSIIFISHDLGVISQIADRVVVMYAGRVVEQGDVYDVFERPNHPYSRALLASIPTRKRRGERLAGIPGRVPSLVAMPAGCTFAPRCRYARQEVCAAAEPEMYTSERQEIRCFMYDPSQAGQWTEADRQRPREAAEPDHRLREPVNGHEHLKPASGGDLVALTGVKTYFGKSAGRLRRLFARGETQAVRAVDDVTMTIHRGEVLGLVGESGSGKSTLGRTILRLAEATAGHVDFDGLDVLAAGKRELRRLRSQAQMIFQETHTSLSPRMRVAELLAEPYLVNKIPDSERLSIAELLELVGLAPEQARKYPHQLSGARRGESGSPAHSRCSPRSSLPTSRQADSTSRLPPASST
jgi:peptide/nickel transport system ATP-binding protein